MTDQEYLQFDINSLNEYDKQYFLLMSFRTFAYMINPSQNYAWATSQKHVHEIQNLNITPGAVTEFLNKYEDECKNFCGSYTKRNFVNMEPVDMFLSLKSLYMPAGIKFTFEQFREKEPFDLRTLFVDANKPKKQKVDASGYEMPIEYDSYKILQKQFNNIFPEITRERK